MAYRPTREADRSGTHFIGSSVALWFFTFLVGTACVRAPARIAGTLVVGTLVLMGLLWWKNRFSHFCEEWLLADLPLRPSTRNTWPRLSRHWKDFANSGRELFALLMGRTIRPSGEMAGQTESLAIVVVIWLYLSFVPYFVASDLACLALFGVCFLAWTALLRPCSLARLRRLATLHYRLRRVYFTYPDRVVGQQGLWTTPARLITRQATYCLALGALFALVAMALAGETVALPLILVILLLPLVAEVILFTVLLSELQYFEALSNDIKTHDSGQRCQWQQLIDRKAGSFRSDERDRILWALDAKTSEPILIERSILAEHVHIRGATGSGKTSGALIPVILQLLEQQPSEQNPDPIIIFDLGGDQAMFHAVRLAAERKGRRFRFFSVQGGHASDYFDPLQGLLHEEMRIPQLASMFVEAFNLDYGLRYGAQYFTEQNLSSFLAVIRYFRQHHQRHPTLQSFHQFLRDNQQKSEFRNAEQILMCISFLLDYPQLNSRQPDPAADDHIYLRRVLEDGEVVYFFLPTLNESAFVREIAGLALYGLLAAAMERGDSGHNAANPRQAWVVIDEFHELVGSSFANLLAQARKFGLGLILANQSTMQLDNKDVNLATLVEENTAIRQYFTISSDDILPFQRLSGDEEKIRTRTTTSRGATSIALDWGKEPALELNEILEASGQRQECFLIVRDGEGAAKPRHAVTLYPMAYDEYHRLRHLPLPRRTSPTPEPAEVQPESSSQQATAAGDAWREERQRRLTALWERFEMDQRFDPPKRRSKT